MTVSTHVLDAVDGRPAAGVQVTLSRLAPGSAGGPPAGSAAWEAVESGVTDSGGRHRFAAATEPGAYRLTFATGAYFAARGTATFYPEVTVTFSVPGPHGSGASGPPGETAAHCHVPLLLSPFGYSTYRGSLQKLNAEVR